jgi:hypothetical protein
MKVKQAIKKVFALAAGAGIVGATLASAMAADLSTYPQPFVQGGVWSDSVIVIGEKAMPSDVMGAIEIAASLQAAAVSVTPVVVDGVTETTIDKGVEIKKSGDKLNYGEILSDVQASALTDSDLPDILKTEEYNENRGETNNRVEYEQTLEFGDDDNSGLFSFTRPDEMDSGDYLFMEDGDLLYTYKIIFDNDVEYEEASDEFEGSKLMMQGNEYTVTKARFTGGALSELTLLAGDQTKWLTQDQPYTLGDHTVMVFNVDEGADKCGIEVDGNVKWIDVGATEIVGGLSVGVLDAIAVRSKDYDQDTCELTFGSMEIILKDGYEVKVNNEDIEGAIVTFDSAAGTWSEMWVSFTPNEDLYLKAGQAWTDPVFGNFKVEFGGINAATEELSFETTSKEKAEFKYMSVDNKEVTVPYRYESGSIFLGTDTDERLLLPGERFYGESRATGTMLLYTTSGGETHILEISKIDVTNEKLDIRDMTYGNTWTDRDFTADNATSEIALGSLGTVNLNISASGYDVTFMNVNGKGNGVPETSKGATLGFYAHSVLLNEQDVTETADITANVINFTLAYDGGSDNRLELLEPVGTTALEWFDKSEDDDDTVYAVTEKGTKVEFDNDNTLSAAITYPEDDVYASVFLAPLAAKVTTAGTGSVNAEKVNTIPVGMSVLDKDASALTKNMIVVGGPCVNTVAAELAGNPVDCAEGYEMGKAKIKLYTRMGKTALLVAGYSAQDSLGAAYVLADYKDYTSKLTGNEVEVVVASLSDIRVTTPSS